MERIDVFHQLIDTDRSAQKLYSDAIAYQESLSEDFCEFRTQLRKEKYDEADAFIATFEQEAVNASDQQISDLNNHLENNLNRVRLLYSQHRNEWSDIIFNKTIKLDNSGRE